MNSLRKRRKSQNVERVKRGYVRCDRVLGFGLVWNISYPLALFFGREVQL